MQAQVTGGATSARATSALQRMPSAPEATLQAALCRLCRRGSLSLRPVLLGGRLTVLVTALDAAAAESALNQYRTLDAPHTGAEAAPGGAAAALGAGSEDRGVEGDQTGHTLAAGGTGGDVWDAGA